MLKWPKDFVYNTRNVITHFWAWLKLVFLDFHPGYLILVVIKHDLSRLLNAGDNFH